MDFFESQEVARKRTGRLVILFVLAVIAIVVMSYLAVAGIYLGMQARRQTDGSVNWDLLLDVRLLMTIGVGTIAVVGFGSLYKLGELRAGGRVVAENLGGRLLDPGSTDHAERRVLNVVEEMAIASGTPVPPVYLMNDERCINAFAAGFSPNDAVIGITRGSAEQLSRDELQGVIAHEFSHILNGDMRLNIRLIGVLHGILMIGLIGGMMLRMALYSGAMHSRRSRDSNPIPIIAIGVALLIVGYVGIFFGRLIKSGVSRQREYLADASAVQFTRNPSGISGALQKIGGLSSGSRMASPRAEEASHLFFGQGIATSFMTMFATHPPLPMRIRRIDPGWDGSYPELTETKIAMPDPTGATGRPTPAELIEQLRTKRGAMGAMVIGGAVMSSALEQIGRPSQEHLEYAAALLAELPEQVRHAAHEPYGARAVVYALLLSDQDDVRRVQWERLAEHADRGVFSETRLLEPFIRQCSPNARLPLLDLTLSALRSLTRDQYEAFKSNVRELIHADDEVDLFEWMLQRMILQHLEPNFSKARREVVQYYNLRGLFDECSLVLSALAHAGHDSPGDSRRAFDQGAAQLGSGRFHLREPSKCRLDALDGALERLSQAAPRIKRQVLLACAVCIAADREVTVREAELLRAIADSLQCPMPPLLPGQDLA